MSCTPADYNGENKPKPCAGSLTGSIPVSSKIYLLEGYLHFKFYRSVLKNIYFMNLKVIKKRDYESPRRDLNPRPRHYQCRALTD